MLRRSCLYLLTVVACPLASGCSDDAPPVEPAPMATCADTRTRITFPSPAWHDGSAITPPAGDAALAALESRRATWGEQLAGIDGFPHRPSFVLPLAGAATAVDPSKIHFYGATTRGGALSALDLAFTTELGGSTERTLILLVRDPVPHDVVELVLAIDATAIESGEVLPACDAAGTGADPRHAAALGRLPSGATGFAIALPLSTSHLMLRSLADATGDDRRVARVGTSAMTNFDRYNVPSDSPLRSHARAAIAEGRFVMDEYRAEDGSITLGEDGLPVATGDTRPGFVLLTPSAGDGPYPLVLYQHGSGFDRTDVVRVADKLTEAGFAVLSLDLPEHGTRERRMGDPSLNFLNFQDARRTRNNFLQTVADHMAIARGIDNLNAALQPITGLTATVDGSRLFYLGMSLGALTGSLTFSSDSSFKAAALFVGGGGYRDILSEGAFSLFVPSFLGQPFPATPALFGMVEILLDAADPLTYAQRNERRELAPRPLILAAAIGDTLIPAVASDSWARAFGTSLGGTAHHQVPAMASVSLPARDNFRFGDDGAAATRVYIQAPMNEVEVTDRHQDLIATDYAQTLVAHCFRTLLDTGSCEVIDTGFANH